jgi:hypothetical protein
MDDEDEASGTKRFKTAETISSPDIVSPVSMASSYSGMGGESPVLSPVIDEWLTTFSCWSLDYKTQALNRLIKICDSSQLKELMDKIKPQFQRDFISLLPREVIVLNSD